MNGEVSELCALTACARIALKDGTRFDYALEKYVNSERFVFVPRNGSEIVEDSAEKWFARLKLLGLNDIIMLLPRTDRNLHAFSNANGGCIVCFFDSGSVTYFNPKWYFDNEKKLWNVEFFESEWSSAPDKKPIFDDNTDEFGSALCDIAQLAEKIGQGGWADVFRQAHDILDGKFGRDSLGYADRIPNIRGISEKNLRVYSAAAKADVFGAMGSWNDSPARYAREKGLSDEYERLSSELFSQIQMALLYSINRI